MTDTDKRKVSTDALETLGTIIDENEKRDAIHLAVIPVKAQEKLFPGQDVGKDGTIKDPVGIVDPFLKSPVFTDQWFWLVIYPRQINSLRHVWSHPSFEDEVNNIEQDCKKKQSRAFIEDFASSYNISFDEIIEGTKDFLEGKGGIELSSEFFDIETPDEFWDHYEVITGKKIKRDEIYESVFECCA